MTTCAWLWVYAGAALMLLELLAPGFVIFFFGLSAATVGALRAVIGEPFSLTWQLAAFSAFSIVYLVLLRRWLKGVFSGSRSQSSADFGNEYVGRVGRITVRVTPSLPGRVMIGDAEWTATAKTALPEGADVRVIAQDNLTMAVAPIA